MVYVASVCVCVVCVWGEMTNIYLFKPIGRTAHTSTHLIPF